jgi:chemotaxis family two-component system response regulator Rcp1
MERGSTANPFQILLAEDNPPDTFLVHEALRQQQIEYEMHVVPDGEKALRFLDRVENGELPCPDIVLLDINLPRRTGTDVLARLRGSDLCREARVVVLSSTEAPGDREALCELGANDYFRKPTNLDDFLKLGEVVKRHLEKR